MTDFSFFFSFFFPLLFVSFFCELTTHLPEFRWGRGNIGHCCIRSAHVICNIDNISIRKLLPSDSFPQPAISESIKQNASCVPPQSVNKKGVLRKLISIISMRYTEKVLYIDVGESSAISAFPLMSLVHCIHDILYLGARREKYLSSF